MKQRVAVCMLIITCALAGCGGSGAGGAAKSSSPSSSAAPSPSGPSTAEVASQVAQVKAAVAKAAHDIAHCPDYVLDNFACSLSVQTATLVAQIQIKKVTAIANPPAELVSLLGATTAALQVVADDNVSACDKKPASASCAGDTLRLRSDMENLTQQLAGWDPYLG